MGGWVRFKPRKGIADVDRAVRSILISAYREVPYYHDLMLRAGLHPSQISGTEDLPRLPITSRRDLMAAGERGFLRPRLLTTVMRPKPLGRPTHHGNDRRTRCGLHELA
jgi:phenylacetate-coenzyme A ligase PaaK-like adenylate-forming protein